MHWAPECVSVYRDWQFTVIQHADSHGVKTQLRL